MQLERLRLAGFKSFVEPAELAIEPGLTGIVGPNGCGKSNLVEALRWVMGESSARRLRGGEMDDVIFAGSDSRPARNVAEVALTIDNGDRDTPFAHNDSATVEIVRRLVRGAGSAYRINGREARAQDVQLLFADAASGPHSWALVGQGRVGMLIAAKPGERRMLLDEAAGTAGLHARRHEAELKLQAAEAN
ncbi:MAG TPA: AAA family ATPase, partial [Stellaceae bacterium]|nr:AAA family ATPase [Stellaceae bacterium]